MQTASRSLTVCLWLFTSDASLMTEFLLNTFNLYLVTSQVLHFSDRVCACVCLQPTDIHATDALLVICLNVCERVGMCVHAFFIFFWSVTRVRSSVASSTKRLITVLNQILVLLDEWQLTKTSSDNTFCTEWILTQDIEMMN